VQVTPYLVAHVAVKCDHEMESYSSEDLSSDEEVSINFYEMHSVSQTDTEVYLLVQLQSELAEGRLKPGLLTRAAPPKTYTNNVVSKVRRLL